jgi:DNA-binding NarL/FixJ family response regulator
MWQHHGIRIFILERDVYARQAVASYFSWDRRTRVLGMAGSVYEILAVLAQEQDELRIDAVTLNTDQAASPLELASLIRMVHNHLQGAQVVCLATRTEIEWVLAARQAGACAFLTREVVGPGVASAIRFVMGRAFTVTQDIADLIQRQPRGDFSGYSILPSRREYVRLTPRIEQALWLCVVEGLPAELAADEMGVSISTVRSYIKEGYRILEEEDSACYPLTVSPAERAFLRFTALEPMETADLIMPWRPAA